MVKRFLTNTNPYSLTGALTRKSVTLIKREDENIPRVLETFNICDYICNYTELVFADLSDTDAYKNDKTSLLFKKSIPTDTVAIKLFKNGDEVATLNDSTYGTVYSSSYFGDNFREGFIIDWRLVASLLGYGCYHIEANLEIINQSNTVKTHQYELQSFSDQKADKTVRIHTFSKGLIEGGVDYTGNNVEWEQMVRFRGSLRNPQVTFETDNYLDTNRKIVQIQDQVTTDYDFQIVGVPQELGKPLIYDKLLANRILITDYGLFNYDRYENLEVYPKSVEESTFFSRYNRGMFTIKFTDKKQNIIKRNYL